LFVEGLQVVMPRNFVDFVKLSVKSQYVQKKKQQQQKKKEKKNQT